MEWLKKYKRRLVEASSTVFLLCLWEALGRLLAAEYFPPFSKVAVSFYELLVYGDVWGHSLLSHAFVSLYRVFLGFAVAFSVAFFLGLFSGLNETVYSALKPLIEAVRPIPPLAWIPFAIILFKFSAASYAFIIFLGAFFPIYLNTIAGVKRTSPVLVDVAKSFGAKRRDMVFKVVIPSALPEIVTGMRIAFGVGWMCIVAAEMIGVMRALGLGFFVITMYELALYPQMIAGMIMIGLMGYVINEVFLKAEESLFKWRVEVSRKL